MSPGAYCDNLGTRTRMYETVNQCKFVFPFLQITSFYAFKLLWSPNKHCFQMSPTSHPQCNSFFSKNIPRTCCISKLKKKLRYWDKIKAFVKGKHNWQQFSVVLVVFVISLVLSRIVSWDFTQQTNFCPRSFSYVIVVFPLYASHKGDYTHVTKTGSSWRGI